MNHIQHTKKKGVTALGMLLILILVGFFAIVLIRVLPAYAEYRSIMRAVTYAAADTTKRDVQQKYITQMQLDGLYYSTVLKETDLEITPTPSGSTVSFAYNKEMLLVGNVYLLLKFTGVASGSAIK